MQALRSARYAASFKPSLLIARRRCLATATANQVHLNAAASSSVAASSGGPIAPPRLDNIEAKWEKMSSEEKLNVHEQLEALQVKDWKELSLDDKKAAYYVAFGPHGPRAPTSQPGDNFKVFLSTVGLVTLAGIVFYAIHSTTTAPRTMTKEWQEASNERAKEMKLNPISGISSEDYKGPGFVQSK